MVSTFSGIFTTPQAGTWSISYSLYSTPDPGNTNAVFLYKNGEQIPESIHTAGHMGGSGHMWFTGGRTVLLSLDVGDTLWLQTEYNNEPSQKILICYEYISK